MSERNLVVLYDGTWNDTTSNTNLKKIYQACSAKNQEFHYEEGVGTAHWEALPGGIYGANIERQILGGYRFLRKRFMDAAVPADQNRVFLFGFSRGAYAVRRLAGLIDFCGLPDKASDVDIAWQLYLNQQPEPVQALIDEGRLFKVSIQNVCVWDTVKTTTDKDFNDSKLPGCVARGYHAMAIDEARQFFPVLKWDDDQRVRQVWFAGVHSDVGGGYPDRSLSDIALKLMIDAAASNGLREKASAVNNLKPDPLGTMHESCKGIWVPFGKKSRTVTADALVHESVRDRKEAGAYDPGNLPDNPTYVSAQQERLAGGDLLKESLRQGAYTLDWLYVIRDKAEKKCVQVLL